MTLAERRHDRPPALQHPALIYEDVEEFLHYTVPFVAEGVGEREPVFVAVGTTELDALRSAIDGSDESHGIHWADTNEWMPEPAPRLAAFHRFVTRELMRRPAHIRLVGEPLWPEAPELSLEWARYESVLNTVFADYPVSLVCTYDASRLAEDVVADARRTHPVVSAGGREAASPDFQDPASLLVRWNHPLTPLPATAKPIPGPVDSTWARAIVMQRATTAGLSPERALDLALATSEILANAAEHGGGAVALHVWMGDGRILCQVDDRGAGVGDPLAGYRPPAPEPTAGRGLWLARQVVDLMQIDSGPSGTSVRLHVRLDRR